VNIAVTSDGFVVQETDINFKRVTLTGQVTLSASKI
jgi:hypothetical protein